MLYIIFDFFMKDLINPFVIHSFRGVFRYDNLTRVLGKHKTLVKYFIEEFHEYFIEILTIVRN